MKHLQQMNKVSIVIPCYNDFEYIEEAVHSALNQTYLNKEIIVVDDGSDSLTKQVLENLRSKIDILIFQNNSGPGHARNAGIKVSSGEFILVLDGDDFFEDSFLEKAVPILLKQSEIKFVSSWYKRVRDTKILDVIKPAGGEISTFLKYNAGVGNGLFRKNDWKRIYGYDEEMKSGFEDWEFFIRLLEEGGVVFIIPEILFNYRLRSRSRTTMANKNKYNLMRYIFLKHHDLYLMYHNEIIDHLLNRLETVEKNESKISHSFEFKLGHLLLKPLRELKNLIFK